MTLTPAELGMKFKRWMRIAPGEMKRALKPELMRVEREAVVSHLSGPRMPRGVGDPINATLQPDTGFLRRSLFSFPEVVGTTLYGRIGAGTWYGRLHEKGIGKQPARPFIRPSIEKRRPHIRTALLQAMMKSEAKA